MPLLTMLPTVVLNLVARWHRPERDANALSGVLADRPDRMAGIYQRLQRAAQL